MTLSVSIDSYSSKPDVATLQFKTYHFVEVEDFYNYVTNGHSVCADFGETNIFNKGRTKDKWLGSDFIFIDLDDVDLSWNDLLTITKINDDWLVPNFIYSTFSHQQKGKKNRYRAVYCFNCTITREDDFKALTRLYNTKFKELFDIKVDECNCRITQPMHGTGKDALKLLISTKYKDLEKIKLLIPEEKEEKKEQIPINDCIWSENEIKHFSSIPLTEFVNQDEGRYLLLDKYRSNWSQIIGYESERWRIVEYNPIFFWDKETKTHSIPRIYHDGEHRRKRLFENLVKLRCIEPMIKKDDLLYNAVYWVVNFTQRNNDPITWKQILDITDKVMHIDTVQYIENRKELITNPFELVRRPGLKKSDVTKLKIKKLMDENKNYKEIMDMLGLSKSQVLKLMKFIKENGSVTININICNGDYSMICGGNGTQTNNDKKTA